MSPSVSLEIVSVRLLAAVRRRVQVSEIGNAWRPALDQVWSFLRQNPGLRTDGHNIFLYHHPTKGEPAMLVDFGVEVTRSFAPSGDVFATETPGGKVARALHVGSYQSVGETHSAIHHWVKENHLAMAGKSWEIYGDPTDDPAKLETQIEYLLA